MPYHNANFTRKDKEALFVWHYLRKVRRHDVPFCYQFINDCYFISKSKLLKIMKEYEIEEIEEPENASVIYHLVISNQYMDYYHTFNHERLKSL